MTKFVPQCYICFRAEKSALLFLYRKFLKSSEMVYNELEIKNYMTKERMCWIRHDVVYEVFCFGLGYLHYLTMEKE